MIDENIAFDVFMKTGNISCYLLHKEMLRNSTDSAFK